MEEEGEEEEEDRPVNQKPSKTLLFALHFILTIKSTENKPSTGWRKKHENTEAATSPYQPQAVRCKKPQN